MSEEARRIDIEQARALAVAILADEGLVSYLTPVGVVALRGLTDDHLLEAQRDRGREALVTIVAAALPPPASSRWPKVTHTLRAWFDTPDWTSSRRWLAKHVTQIPPAMPAQLEVAAERARAANNEEGRYLFAAHAKVLREAPHIGIVAAYRVAFGETDLDDLDATSANNNAPLPPLGATLVAAIENPYWRGEEAATGAQIPTANYLTVKGKPYLAARLGIFHEDATRDRTRHIVPSPTEQGSPLSTASPASVARVEMGELLSTLRALRARRSEFPRQRQCYRRLLRLDGHAHAFSSPERNAVLENYGLALLDQADGTADAAQRLYLLQEAEQAFRQTAAGVAVGTALWAKRMTLLGGTLRDQAQLHADTARRRSLLTTAIAAHQQALQAREVDPATWITCQNNLGNALRDQAALHLGSEQYELLTKAASAFQHLVQRVAPGVPSWPMYQSNFGTVLSAQAELRTSAERLRLLRVAEQAYRAAVSTSRPEDPDRAGYLNNLGNCLGAQADLRRGGARLRILKEAERAYHRAIRTPTPDLADAAGYRNSLGNNLSNQAELQAGAEQLRLLQRARRAYQSAVTMSTVGTPAWADYQVSLGNNWSDLAELQRGTKQLRLLLKSEQAYRHALSVRSAGTSAWVKVQTNLGILLRTQATLVTNEAQHRHLLEEAASAHEQALAAIPQELQPAVARDLAVELARTYVRHSALPDAEHDMLGRAWATVAIALAAADLLELRTPSLAFRQEAWAENARLYNLAGSIRARQGYLDQAVALIERGRARGLAEATGRRSADLAQLSAADRTRYLQAVERVQAIEAADREQDDPLALLEEARAANEHLAAVVARLRQTTSDFLPDRTISLDALRARLRVGEALVYLIPQETGTLVAVIPQGDHEPAIMWQTGLTSDGLAALVVRPTADGRTLGGYLPAALGWSRPRMRARTLLRVLDALLPALGDALMRRVISLLHERSCSHAILVSSGYLSVLPLHAACYAPLAGEVATATADRRYACDDVAITYTPSGAALLDARAAAARQRRAGPARRLFVAGNPQLSAPGEPWTRATRGYLPYAEWEARRVAEIAAAHTPLAIDLALGEHASDVRVVEGVNQSQVAHLALHAAFDLNEPQRSAFRTAFRTHLLLRDLLDGRRVRLAQIRLVVLSACQSALRDVDYLSEEAVGLFGALLAGGVPGVIGCLWAVNDLATAALMESFAERYLGAQQPPAVALGAAIRDLRGMDASPNPSQDGGEDILTRTDERLPIGNAPVVQARVRWEEMARQDAETVAQVRALSAAEHTRLGRDIEFFRAHARVRVHPYFWAAFVFYGTSEPLDIAVESTPDA